MLPASKVSSGRNLYLVQVAYLGVCQHPMTQARPYHPPGPVIEFDGKFDIGVSNSGAKLLSSSVSDRIT